MYDNKPTPIIQTERQILTTSGTFGPPIADTVAIAKIASTGVIKAHATIDSIVQIIINATDIQTS